MQPQKSVRIRLPHNFTPRFYQLPILQALDSGIKRAVWCAHRRSGKDVTIFNWCIKELAKTTCTCFYVMPTYSQAKKVIWDAVNNDGFRILDYVPKELVAQKNAQEMKIRFTNGSLLQLIGSDNIDSLMGTNPKIVVFSEYALQDPAAWDYIRPILKVNGGYAIFISTPRGRNHFFDLYRTAQVTEGWFAQKLSIEDTNVLTKEDVKQEMVEGMSEELALQEYYCSFDRGIEGSYYGKLMNRMVEEGRVTKLYYDRSKLVCTAWDLGWDDDTAVVFFQVSGNSVNILDCHSDNNKTLSYWADFIKSKPYKYDKHLFPHDVEQIDGLGSGCTRKELLEDLGIEVTTVGRNDNNRLLPIADGIESLKALMDSRILICSENCKPLIKALEMYHKDWDEKHKVYSNKPRHDWSSHYADCARYMALGLHKLIGSKGSITSDAKALKSYWG